MAVQGTYGWHPSWLCFWDFRSQKLNTHQTRVATKSQIYKPKHVYFVYACGQSITSAGVIWLLHWAKEKNKASFELRPERRESPTKTVADQLRASHARYCFSKYFTPWKESDYFQTTGIGQILAIFLFPLKIINSKITCTSTSLTIQTPTVQAPCCLS